eukprot:6186709-Pleurochrysis_carterae.AAC.3
MLGAPKTGGGLHRPKRSLCVPARLRARARARSPAHTHVRVSVCAREYLCVLARMRILTDRAKVMSVEARTEVKGETITLVRVLGASTSP